MGKLLAICTSPQRGTVKTEVESARLTPEWGIETDAHGGNWHRQVSLLSAEKIENFRKKIWVDYGAFGENLVVEGFDFRNLPVTSRFQVGEVVLEMTQIGKECHNDCVIKQQTGECIMPHEGVFARVLHGGTLHVGDEMILLSPEEDPPLRAAVITLSDKGARGEREDKSGPLIVENIAFCTGLIIIRTGPYFTFHIKFVSFMHIFLSRFCQSAPKDKIMPLRTFRNLRSVCQCIGTV